MPNFFKLIEKKKEIKKKTHENLRICLHFLYTQAQSTKCSIARRLLTFVMFIPDLYQLLDLHIFSILPSPFPSVVTLRRAYAYKLFGTYISILSINMKAFKRSSTE